MKGLENKVALVTGAAQGIGKAIAMTLAHAGAHLVIADVNLEKAQETASEIEKLGREAIAVTVDVANVASVDAMVAEVTQKFEKIDFLVNNAGITRDTLMIRMKEDEWDKVIAVNLKGTFNCMKSVGKLMMKQRSGRVVNIASVVGVMGNAGQANYSASKAGVIALTKTMAKEFASRGVTSNAVAPGYIETEMTAHLSDAAKQAFLQNIPLKRPGTAADVANVVTFLLSDAASYLTGQVINIDGGMIMS